MLYFVKFLMIFSIAVLVVFNARAVILAETELRNLSNIVSEAKQKKVSEDDIELLKENKQVDKSALEEDVRGIESKVEESKEVFMDSASFLERQAKAEKDFAKNLVNVAEENTKNYASRISPQQSAVDEILGHYGKIKNEEKPQKEGLFIFVSFSMPKSLLEKLDTLAKKANGKLLIRGLKNNSFKETILHIKSIKKEGIGIDIDPNAFVAFEIKQVPAFVISDGRKFDKLIGNVSVRYALEKFEHHGELKKEAKEYLERLGDAAH